MSFPGFLEQKGFWALFFVTLLALMLRFFNFADLGIGNLFTPLLSDQWANRGTIFSTLLLIPAGL